MTQQIQLFNTLKRQKKIFKPHSKDAIRLYTCGPTVYDYAHIGNLRTYVFEDLLKRTFQFLGYNVKHIMNITDVDDKTIKGAIQKNQSLIEYTQVYKEAFFEDLKTLHIDPADQYPLATDHIPEMIQMIETLIKKGIAYQGSDQSIYFSIRKYSDYGKLSHLKLEDLQEGASQRLEQDEYDKESATDFVLWKSYDPKRDGEIFWESPFGKGRPGWHLECSAMAVKYLGETLDLHMGGVDNIFPHHENEIAQSESCFCKTFCPFWVHVEHLIVEGKKMSKSLGNFFTLRDLLKKGYEGSDVRYLLLQTHYRTQLNFTEDGLKGAKVANGRIQNFVQRLQEIHEEGESDVPIEQTLSDYNEKFTEALKDDMNISVSLAALFDFMREINGRIDEKKISKADAKKVLHLLENWNLVLAVIDFSKAQEEAPEELVQALKERQTARKEKNWGEADRLRDFILSKGYLIEDTPQGAKLKKK